MKIRVIIATVFMYCCLTLPSGTTESAELAGHYYLHGVREVGSELLLQPNGRYQWLLAYGAADFFSEGTWRVDSGQVILQADVKQGKLPLFRLDTGSPVTAWSVEAEEFLQQQLHQQAVQQIQERCHQTSSAGEPSAPRDAQCTMPQPPTIDRGRPETWQGGWAVRIADTATGALFGNIDVELVFADGYREYHTTGRSGMVAVPRRSEAPLRELVLKVVDGEYPPESILLPEPEYRSGAVFQVHLDGHNIIKPLFHEMVLIIKENDLMAPDLGGRYGKQGPGTSGQRTKPAP